MVFICWGCSVNAGWLQCVPACPLPNECPLHRMVHQGSLGALGEVGVNGGHLSKASMGGGGGHGDEWNVCPAAHNCSAPLTGDRGQS